MGSVLRDFQPNEANANSYERDKGHRLTAHFDDRQLSGEILVNLSLCSSCIMTFEKVRGGERASRRERGEYRETGGGREMGEFANRSRCILPLHTLARASTSHASNHPPAC